MIFLTKKNRKSSFFNQFAESWQFFTKMETLTLKSRIAPVCPLMKTILQKHEFHEISMWFSLKPVPTPQECSDCPETASKRFS